MLIAVEKRAVIRSQLVMKNETYHDYVIKDGEFIGEFEKMYQRFDDPWMQSSQPNKYARMAGIVHLKNFPIRSVLECGCGLGYYANWIHQDTGIIPQSVDLSETAIDKARALFPHLNFDVADITSDLMSYRGTDCVLLSEIIWYILPDLDSILQTLGNEFAGRYLLVNQVFYKGTQQYGTDYFTTPAEFIDYVPFQLVGYCEATTERDTTVESSIIFRIEQKRS